MACALPARLFSVFVKRRRADVDRRGRGVRFGVTDASGEPGGVTKQTISINVLPDPNPTPRR